jgi:SP family sugar:H+ symporter-like MFS transporter
MALQAFQQLTGINYFFYYGTSVFVGVGIDNPYVTAMILGGVNVGATCFSLLLVEACGRRISLMVGALFQTVCFLVFASVGHFCFLAAQQSGDQDGMKSYGAVMIVFACLFICSFACTWGPIAWVVVGEIYPYRYKATAIAFASCSNW